MTTHVFHSNCVWCGTRHDRATNADASEAGQPVDGDVTICFACGEWLVFERSYLRAPTPEEFIEIGLDEDCRRARRAWVRTIHELGRPSGQFADSNNPP